MNDLSVTSAGTFLQTLRKLPVWLFAGLAIAGFAALFFPPLGKVDMQALRAEWGVYIWLEAITFTALALTRGIDELVTRYLAHRAEVNGARALRFLAKQNGCWWNLAKQPDERLFSQIALYIDVSNMSDRPIRLLRARIISPAVKGETLNEMVTLNATCWARLI